MPPKLEHLQATRQAADAATTQSEVATKQSKNSDRALVQSQRAWVGPSLAKITGTIEIGKPITVEVNYSNSGKEPALNFIYAVDLFVATNEDDANGMSIAKIEASFKGCREATNLRAGSVLFPNASNTLTAKSKEDLIDQRVIDGDASVIITGCFLYKSFDVVRHTYFCNYYNAKRAKLDNLNICVSGAGAD